MMPHSRRPIPGDRPTALRRALIAIGALIDEPDVKLPVDLDTLDDKTALALIGALARRLQASGYGAPSAS